MPDLWSNLDFSTAMRSIPVTTVTAYIKRSRGRVKTAALSGISPTQPIVLKCIANRCKALAHLQVHRGIIGTSLIVAAPALRSLHTLIVGADISLDCVSQLLGECSGLRKADFRSVTARSRVQWSGDLSRLRSLTIGAKRDLDFRGSFLDTVSITIV